MTKSRNPRATAAAVSTDTAAAVACASKAGLTKRHRRFLPRTLSKLVASLSSLGIRQFDVSRNPAAFVKNNALSTPKAKSKRAPRRRVRHIPTAAVKQTQTNKKTNGKNANAKPTNANNSVLRPKTKGVAKKNRQASKKPATKKANKKRPVPAAPVVTTRAMMRRYAQRSRTAGFADLPESFPNVNTFGSILDDTSGVSMKKTNKQKTQKKRRQRRRQPLCHPPHSPAPSSMMFSPIRVDEDLDDFTNDDTFVSDAARLPSSVFEREARDDEEQWADTDDEDAAWERGARNAPSVLGSPVAWTPTSPAPCR
jgi:hypothetical protein|tara:strand:- start:545 stop:1477 length:933 start_codon:yes stop_codon:yes gene_type:complete